VCYEEASVAAMEIVLLCTAEAVARMWVWAERPMLIGDFIQNIRLLGVMVQMIRR
jgi:hypothetical protein